MHRDRVHFALPVSSEYAILWQSVSHDGMLIIKEGIHVMVW